ncbi:hypothetical protein BJ980_000305 [Nocardioides daedukensis]|uniref:SipW-cognate class signal peptide n=1 Tax=Nocardioides daedukensis TaxID=634462 RepID=A0A7Y9RVH6_9ACTN|nr:hypothetical protein [Nocardioides daedukensis]NYG57382.1 hypothetical protein [Nocardioides daedukensis]
MSKHVAERRRRVDGALSLKIRAVLCLGILAAPATVTTMAFWTDTATIHSGTLASGSLDLTVGGTVADSGHLPGQGGTHEYSQLTIANMIPGESIARPFVVRNVGSTAFTYNAAITTEDNNLVEASAGLEVQVFVGGTPTNVGTEQAGTRVGTCPTGSSVMSRQPVSTTPVPVHAARQTLAKAGATDDHRVYCAVIALSATSSNALQNKGTSLVIALDAAQAATP